MLFTTRLVPPELVSVTTPKLVVPICWLPKLKLLGESVTAAGMPMFVPLPVRLTVCGLPMALVEILSEPVRFPVAVGAKVIVIVQEAPAASVAGKLVGQVPPERAKSPLTVMVFRLRLVLAKFVSEMFWLVLLVPTRWLPKLRLGDDTVMAEEPGVPVTKRLTLFGLLLALLVIRSA